MNNFWLLFAIPGATVVAILIVILIGSQLEARKGRRTK